MENIHEDRQTARDAGVNEHKKEEKKKLSRGAKLFKEARDIVVVLTVFMLIYVLFFRAVVVVGNSMFDTLHNGDQLLLVNQLFCGDPERGDIIVASKDSFRGGECIVKRVIAVEGDVVKIDQSGVIYVNGEALDESYVSTPTYPPHWVSGGAYVVEVGEGCVFVLGDNRTDSTDSRSTSIGLLDEREILGKVFFLLIPGADRNGDRDFSRIGVVR